METFNERIHTLVCEVVDSLGRISTRTIKYRVDYDEVRSLFWWEKIPGQKENISS